MRNKIFLFILLALFSTVSGCDWIKVLLKAGETVPVTVQKPREIDRVETISTPARFFINKRVEVTIPESAVLDRMFVEEGQLVKQDQPLFKLEEESLLILIGQLRTEQRQKNMEMDNLEYTLRNRDRLIDEGVIDNDKYDSVENEVKEKEMEIERINLQIRELDKRRADSTYNSSINGTVEKVISTPPGSNLPDNKPIVVIAETNPMLATFQLTPDEVGAVSEGMPVIFDFINIAGKKESGIIKSISTEPDKNTGMFEVKCTVPNDTNTIKAGTTARAEITSKIKRRFFMIPRVALVSDGRRHFVFVVENDIAHKKQVRIHKYVDADVEIATGISESDLVVTKGNDKLNEGTVVELWGNY